ncbi:hypothetical protein ACHAWF_006599, partial [Thalassiosira exigua]
MKRRRPIFTFFVGRRRRRPLPPCCRRRSSPARSASASIATVRIDRASPHFNFENRKSEIGRCRQSGGNNAMAAAAAAAAAARGVGSGLGRSGRRRPPSGGGLERPAAGPGPGPGPPPTPVPSGNRASLLRGRRAPGFDLVRSRGIVGDGSRARRDRIAPAARGRRPATRLQIRTILSYRAPSTAYPPADGIAAANSVVVHGGMGAATKTPHPILDLLSRSLRHFLLRPRSLPLPRYVSPTHYSFTLSECFGHSSFLLVAASYYSQDFLELRIMAAMGSASMLVFTYFHPHGRVLWLPLKWNVAFIAINAYRIGKVLWSRWKAEGMNEELKRFGKEHLGTLTSVDYWRLASLAEEEEFEEGDLVLHQVSSSERCVFVFGFVFRNCTSWASARLLGPQLANCRHRPTLRCGIGQFRSTTSRPLTLGRVRVQVQAGVFGGRRKPPANILPNIGPMKKRTPPRPWIRAPVVETLASTSWSAVDPDAFSSRRRARKEYGTEQNERDGSGIGVRCEGGMPSVDSGEGDRVSFSGRGRGGGGDLESDRQGRLVCRSSIDASRTKHPRGADSPGSSIFDVRWLFGRGRRALPLPGTGAYSCRSLGIGWLPPGDLGGAHNPHIRIVLEGELEVLRDGTLTYVLEEGNFVSEGGLHAGLMLRGSIESCGSIVVGPPFDPSDVGQKVTWRKDDGREGGGEETVDNDGRDDDDGDAPRKKNRVRCLRWDRAELADLLESDRGLRSALQAALSWDVVRKLKAQRHVLAEGRVRDPTAWTKRREDQGNARYAGILQNVLGRDPAEVRELSEVLAKYRRIHQIEDVDHEKALARCGWTEEEFREGRRRRRVPAEEEEDEDLDDVDDEEWEDARWRRVKRYGSKLARSILP